MSKKFEAVNNWLKFNRKHAKESCSFCTAGICAAIQKALDFCARYYLYDLPEEDIIEILTIAQDEIAKKIIQGKPIDAPSSLIGSIIKRDKIDYLRNLSRKKKLIPYDENSYIGYNANNFQSNNEYEKTTENIDTPKLDYVETENIYSSNSISNPPFTKDASKVIEDRDLIDKAIADLKRSNMNLYVEVFVEYYELLKLNKVVSLQDIADKIHKNKRTVERHLKIIKDFFKKRDINK